MEYRTIRELCEIVADCPHSTPVWTSSGKIVVRNQNIKNGRIDLSVPSYTDEKHFEQRIRRARPIPGDIIITREAPIGDVGMIPESVECCLGQRMVLLRANPEVCDKHYLLYSLQSRYVQHQISWSEGTGTTVSNLRIPHLEQLKIPYPSMKTQKAIANILRSIEDKMEINRKINDNLQQQAYFYFVRLFVENADPTWRIGTISDLGTVVGGGTPSKAKQEYYAENGIAWITPKDLSVDKSKFISHGENDISELGYRNSSATIMPIGTVLFSSRAPIGYIAIASNEVTTNQGFKSVVPHAEIGTPYIYYFLLHNLPLIESKASGSTFKEVSGSVMKSVEAVIPDTATLAKFNDFCYPLFEMQAKFELENRRLANLRDLLLPKLISGEIDMQGKI